MLNNTALARQDPEVIGERLAALGLRPDQITRHVFHLTLRLVPSWTKERRRQWIAKGRARSTTPWFNVTEPDVLYLLPTLRERPWYWSKFTTTSDARHSWVGVGIAKALGLSGTQKDIGVAAEDIVEQLVEMGVIERGPSTRAIRARFVVVNSYRVRLPKR